MAALQELSARLCLFTGALPLSAWKQSTVRVCRSHRNLEVYFSLSSSLLFAYGRQPSPRCLCTGRDDVRPVVIDRNLTDQSSIDVPDARETQDEKITPKFTEKRSSSAADFVRNFPPKEGRCPNYLKLSDKELFANCNMDTYRASGPGGQHRNKTESAVRLRHTPTGLVSQAADDRSQHINRSLALTRLRQVIALEVRDAVVLEGYTPSPELLRILPSPKGSKRGSVQRVGPNHPEFVLGMKDLLDFLLAMDGSISKAGAILGLSTGALSKLVLSNNSLWQGVNKIRADKGLKPLRQSN